MFNAKAKVVHIFIEMKSIFEWKKNTKENKEKS